MNQLMIRSFDVQAEKICQGAERFSVPSAVGPVVGLESELSVFSDELSLEEVGVRRDSMLEENPDVSCELGRTQLEFRTPPVHILRRGFSGLEEELSGRYERIRLQALAKDLHILRIGSNPFFRILGAARTDAPRYQKVPDFQNANRRCTIDPLIGANGNRINAGDASSISLFQALHINLQADSLVDAVDKLNRSLMLSPYVLAAAGNSRYLHLADTGMNEVRMIVWEMSHDTRTRDDIRRGIGLRVGLPERYFENIRDYFDRIRRYPFILEDLERALAIGIGLSWLDARIKFLGDRAIVELRSLPTLPTTANEISFVSFYLGRLLYSQMVREPLLPIEMVAENRLSAMIYGLSGSYWCSSGGNFQEIPGPEMFLSELRKASIGLAENGLGPVPLQAIEDWAERGSPSDRLFRALDGQSRPSVPKMVFGLWRTGMLDMC